MAVERFECKARAKINLGLDVVRRLENGYHEVKMIMQTIDLYDELSFRVRKDLDIILSIDNQQLSISDNLIIHAAKMMQEQYSIRQGIEISLKKNIPIIFNAFCTLDNSTRWKIRTRNNLHQSR